MSEIELKKLQNWISEGILNFGTYIYGEDVFKTPEHIQEAAYYIDEFKNKRIQNLALSMPPGHGKSNLCSRLLPPYLIGELERIRILTASYGFDLSKSFATDFERIVNGSRFQQVYNKPIIAGSISDKFFSFGDEYYYRYSSVGGAITGFRGEVIILDDVIKNAAQARSPAYIKDLKDWYDTTMASRKASDDSQILFLMTRWTEDDLMQYVLDADTKNSWVKVNMPAIRDGKALWEEQYSLEFLQEIERRNPKQFACVYMGQPESSSNKEFDLDKYEILDNDYEYNNYLYTFGSWDTASTDGEGSCESVGTHWGVKLNSIELIDYHKGKYTVPKLKKVIKKKSEEWGNRYVVIENASSGIGLLQDRDIKKLGAVPIAANVDKKIDLVKIKLEEKLAKLKDLPDITTQIENYPTGKLKDAVSSVVNGIYWYFTEKVFNSDNKLEKGNRKRKSYKAPRRGRALRY